MKIVRQGMAVEGIRASKLIFMPSRGKESMSRLIDAEKLKQTLRNAQINDLISHVADKNVFDIIDEQPTAYEVDEVITNIKKLPIQDFLGVDYIPMTATLNQVVSGGNDYLPNSILRLSGDYIRGYTKAIQDIQSIVDEIAFNKKLNNKSIKELLKCVLKYRANIRERRNGFIRWNVVTKNFEWYECKE